MAVQTNEGLTRPANATLSPYTLVDVNSSGNLVNTGVSTTFDVVGVAQGDGLTNGSTYAAGQLVPVKTWRSGGTHKVTTDATAISIGTLVYKGAAGVVTATPTGSVIVGRALEANGSTAGAIIEVVPF
jgi:3D (Asp-Asp-Asp) domain-containing protein